MRFIGSAIEKGLEASTHIIASALGLWRLWPPHCPDAVPGSMAAAYYHFVVMFIGAMETLWLASLHTRHLIKWEPIWCALPFA